MTREQRVEVFNRIMGQPIGEDPKQVPLKLRQLAISLIFEELAETADANAVQKTFLNLCFQHIIKKLPELENVEVVYDNTILSLQDVFKLLLEKNQIKDNETGEEVNPVLLLDGLCDVQYTLSWAVNILGQKKHFEDAYIETCKSNDSKACATPEEAEKTKEHWTNEENGEAHYIDPVEVDGKIYYVVKRSKDGKVRKSINYYPADFAQFFEKK